MVLLIDADSLVFASCYRKRETPEDEPFFSDIADARNKFDEQYMSIVNHLEEIYPVEKIITFSGSKGNFRKLITKKYKSNRNYNNMPPLLNEMHQFVKEQYDSISGYGVETDDMVARYWHTISQDIGRDEVIIVSLDKDYRQFNALIYNYHWNTKQILDISKDEALYNFYEQMLIGDPSDCVNYFKGKGVKFAQKYFLDCETEYQYRKQLYKLFKEKYKSKAKEKYVECYSLLKLRTN